VCCFCLFVVVFVALKCVTTANKYINRVGVCWIAVDGYGNSVLVQDSVVARANDDGDIPVWIQRMW